MKEETKIKMVILDPKKVEEFSKSYNLSEVSLEIGRSRCYLRQGADGHSRGIRRSDYELIKNKYGVDLQAYREVAPEERELFKNWGGISDRNRSKSHDLLVKGILVDKDKLREAVEKSGMSVNDFSRDLGRSRSYIQNFLSTSPSTKNFLTINATVYELIKVKYGIDIKLKELPKPVEEKPKYEGINKEVPQGQEDIYLAVYFGVQDALKDFLKDMKPNNLTSAGQAIVKRAEDLRKREELTY